MFLSHAQVGFEKLNELFGLPADTKIVSVKENDFGNVLMVKIASPREPVNVNLQPSDPVSRLGEAYLPGAVGLSWDEANKSSTRGENAETPLNTEETQN